MTKLSKITQAPKAQVSSDYVRGRKAAFKDLKDAAKHFEDYIQVNFESEDLNEEGELNLEVKTFIKDVEKTPNFKQKIARDLKEWEEI